MADVLLGPSGSEVTLPPCRALDNTPDNQDVEHASPVEQETMLDGSIKYNELEKTPRTWTLFFGYLTAAQFAILEALRVMGGAMRYQDNNDSATWYDVIITGWTPARIKTISVDGTPYYQATMTLGELL
jgi:hypothetical protein